MATKPHFSRQAFQFFRELKQNNTRDWFAENKSRFEDDVKGPALRLIEDLSPLLHDLSPHFTATPRSLFRIYRDTRFGKGKTPYKAAAGIHFRHEQLKDAHAPSFYFHLSPATCSSHTASGDQPPPPSGRSASTSWKILRDGKGWLTAPDSRKYSSSKAIVLSERQGASTPTIP